MKKERVFEDAFKSANPNFEINETVISEIEMALNESGLDSILLKGQVQSGKTATYILLMARLFDKNFDGTIILTKNANDLVNATETRISKSFESIEELITEIDLNNSENLAKCELDGKIIAVSKKYKGDIEKLITILNNNPTLLSAKLLIIDDESDWGSNGYNKQGKYDEEYFNTICLSILELRKKLFNSKYLSVTATPISLFFANYWMIRPQKTFLLPTHSNYLGIEELFLSENTTMKKIRENFIPQEEFETLLTIDDLEIVLESLPNITKSILAFIVGGLMLKEEKRYSMLVHIDTKLEGQKKQKEVLSKIVSQLFNAISSNGEFVIKTLKETYVDIVESLGDEKYTFEEIKDLVATALDEKVKITLMNSDNKAKVPLDKAGNIKNTVPFSIFMGAYAVDRGVTFNNMISFVFGRPTKISNLDSSIQQLRILGARSKEDLPVTRIYCTESQLEKWQEFARIDCILNENLELMVDANLSAAETLFGNQMSYLVPSTNMKGVRLTAPNKIEGRLLEYRPYSRILPKGFFPKEQSKELVEENMNLINSLEDKYGVNEAFGKQYIEIKTEEAIQLLSNSYTALSSKNMSELLNKLTQSVFFLNWLKNNQTDTVLLYCKYNRKRKLERSSGKFDDSPDSGENGDFEYAKKIGIKNPVLLMLHQGGTESGGIPFFWPVLVLPKEMPYNFKTVK